MDSQKTAALELVAATIEREGLRRQAASPDLNPTPGTVEGPKMIADLEEWARRLSASERRCERALSAMAEYAEA